MDQKSLPSFKVKLIDPDIYYPAKRSMVFFNWGFNVAFAMGIGISVSGFSSIAMLHFAIGIAFSIISFLNLRRMRSAHSGLFLEMNREGLRICDDSGAAVENIPLSEMDDLSIPGEDQIPYNSIKAEWKELMHGARPNFVSFKHGEQKRELHFEWESSYMMRQLEKVADIWVNDDLNRTIRV
ncbi:MAG: hypothetical protein EA411_07390 [Saprospirales bacterium]|nr:MAG: hypothetical protein EA411_07390 [Saprospirales bacterium]